MRVCVGGWVGVICKWYLMFSQSSRSIQSVYTNPILYCITQSACI